MRHEPEKKVGAHAPRPRRASRWQRWSVRILLPVLLLAFAVGPTAQTSCSPRMARFMAGALIVGAAVAVIANHDAHHHYHGCGHEYVVVEEREVYHYEGRWEYYDDQTGEWYYYTEEPVPVRERTVHHYYY